MSSRKSPLYKIATTVFRSCERLNGNLGRTWTGSKREGFSSEISQSPASFNKGCLLIKGAAGSKDLNWVTPTGRLVDIDEGKATLVVVLGSSTTSVSAYSGSCENVYKEEHAKGRRSLHATCNIPEGSIAPLNFHRSTDVLCDGWQHRYQYYRRDSHSRKQLRL